MRTLTSQPVALLGGHLCQDLQTPEASKLLVKGNKALRFKSNRTQ